ncbi:hypothetical protein TD95_002013 [Thielaviopsis punctulata]|uniref:RING-type domain-containing protein n=1 Tax=Thielaviopsis punctulata TaxID=72032 RepID=A0A0F4ZAW1_9PEZI|nr:hypothetical protein TD95_002013 [Thielaviopsis punctulata]
MSSIVSDFIINPVLRQARRISEISRSSTSTVNADDGSVEFHHKNPDQVLIATTTSAIAQESDPALTCSSGLDPADLDTASTASVSVDMSTQHTLDASHLVSDEESAPPSLLSSALPISHRNSNTNPSILSQSLNSVPPATNDAGALNRSPGFNELPEDDGMQEMRTRIREIQSMNASPSEKGKLLHETLMKNHLNIKAHTCTSAPISEPPRTPARQIQKKLAVASHLSASPLASSWTGLGFWNQQDSEEVFTLTQEDVEPTFYLDPEDDEIYKGCKHYRRNVKLQCSTCSKWYTCRLCHDNKEDHELVRTETKNMLCMSCACPQRVSDTCVNCGESAARYYCNICKLWEDRPNRAIYHCNDCGICRKGNGLGKDFFHCKKCNACISMSTQYSHKCIERATDCNCPICEDYLFTSRKTVVFMDCGHSIHKSCHERYLASGSFKCPLCNKAITNTETLFRSIDLAIQQQPMPEDYKDTKALVLCHECTTRTTVPYHWLGLKCDANSYVYDTFEPGNFGFSLSR